MNWDVEREEKHLRDFHHITDERVINYWLTRFKNEQKNT